jgi:hypothetical protein
MNSPTFRLLSWILPLACVLMTLFLLTVGLWPFNPFPPNTATWLPERRGVRLSEHSLIFSPGAMLTSGQALPGSFCTLEVQLMTELHDFRNAGTILGFYTPGNPLQFRLMQYNDELLIRKDYKDEHNRLKTIELELEHALVKGQPVAFTITAGVDGATAYRNGVLAGTSPKMKLSCADFSGQLIIGNSPVTENSWRGNLLKVSAYDRSVSDSQVSQHDQLLSTDLSELSQDSLSDHRIAEYAFTEGSGRTIHNSAGSAPDLRMPERFRTLHRQFLIWPWEETRDKLELRDIAINIFGFVPFGFLVFAHLLLIRGNHHALWMTVLAGFAVSLTIEILQTFIPERGSGILDVFTNTLGACLGAWLFQRLGIQNFISGWLLRATLGGPSKVEH